MKKRYIQGKNGELVEVSADYRPEPRADYQVIGDIAPYRSQIDGRMITSRSQHREHLREHDCVEVGNDSSLQRQRGPIESPPGLKELIARQVYDRLRYK